MKDILKTQASAFPPPTPTPFAHTACFVSLRGREPPGWRWWSQGQDEDAGCPPSLWVRTFPVVISWLRLVSPHSQDIRQICILYRPDTHRSRKASLLSIPPIRPMSYCSCSLGNISDYSNIMYFYVVSSSFREWGRMSQGYQLCSFDKFVPFYLFFPIPLGYSVVPDLGAIPVSYNG